MELKQISYFIAAIECRSLNKAAEKLYTTQSNISKAIMNLEESLGVKLLERTVRGVFPTPTGEKIYEQSKLLLNTVDHIHEIAEDSTYDLLRIYSYPSQVISGKLIEYYKSNIEQDLHIEFQEGDIYKVLGGLKSYQCDIGFHYYAASEEGRFSKLVKQYGLEHHDLNTYNLCVFMGKTHPMFYKTELVIEDLSKLKFVQEHSGSFSAIELLSCVSRGQVTAKDIHHIYHTNVGHSVIKLMEETHLCNIGFDLSALEYEVNGYKKLRIQGCDGDVRLAYITRHGHEFSNHEKGFLAYIDKEFKRLKDITSVIKK